MKMRKIISAEEEEKKRKRNQLILGGILVFIMVFSTVAYSFQSYSPTQTAQTNTTQNYNGFALSQQNGFWILSKNGSNFVFLYNPNEAENINAQLNPLSSYGGKTLFVKSDSIEAESEIRVNMAPFVDKIEIAENQNCGENSIIIKESNETSVYQDKNCVFILGKKENLAKTTDEFLFKILGIAYQK